MSPSILLVPVGPPPPEAVLAALVVRLERAFGRTVRITDPVTPPAAARIGPDRYAAGPIRAAIAASWGCGCRDRLVGVTAASVAGEESAPGCGGVLLAALRESGFGTIIRDIGRSYGLEECADPSCAMNPAGEAETLCRACRDRY